MFLQAFIIFPATIVFFFSVIWSGGKRGFCFKEDFPEQALPFAICSIKGQRKTPSMYVIYCFSHAWRCEHLDSKLGLLVLHYFCSSSRGAIQTTRHRPVCHLFFSCFQFFSASGSFQMNQLFASGGQSIEASASVSPMNIKGWFHLGLIRLISQSNGLSRVFYHLHVESEKKKV